MSTNDRLNKLEAENAELRARLDKLEPKGPKVEFKPPPYQPVDWTAGMSMGRGAMAAMAAAVPDNIVRDIVGNNVRSAPVSKPAEPPVVPSQKGWRKPVELGPYDGQRWVDAQIDVQDALDRAERAKRLGVKPE
jgi:hypothetical protein